MKKGLFIVAILLGFTSFGQEKSVKELNDTKIRDEKPELIGWSSDINSRPLVFTIDDYYRKQVLQPYSLIIRLYCGNISKESREAYFERASNKIGPLNQESPFLHTLTGSTYTFDFLRYSVR